VQFTVNTTSGAKLTNIAIHLCASGFSSYTQSSFGYSNDTRCVYDDGNFDSSDNGIDPSGTTYAGIVPSYAPGCFAKNQKYNGTESTSDLPGGPLGLQVFNGTVNWLNSQGAGGTLTCGSGSGCDLVIQVGLTTGTAITYFIQPLTFGEVSSSTTSSSTPSS